MTKKWSEWLPDMLMRAPGCPAIMAEHETRRAAQEFFEGSRAWRAVLDPVSIDANEPEMRVLADDGATEIVRVERVVLGGAKLDCLSLDEVGEWFGADWLTQTGTPKAVTATTALSIRLVPYPVEALNSQLTTTVSLKPAETAAGIPDELYAKYREPIAAGAIARLLLLPDKPWTNMELSGVFAAKFSDAVTSARIGATRAFGRGRIVSHPVWC